MHYFCLDWCITIVWITGSCFLVILAWQYQCSSEVEWHGDFNCIANVLNCGPERSSDASRYVQVRKEKEHILTLSITQLSIHRQMYHMAIKTHRNTIVLECSTIKFRRGRVLASVKGFVHAVSDWVRQSYLLTGLSKQKLVVAAWTLFVWINNQSKSPFFYE